jgi:glyoxalase family protein
MTHGLHHVTAISGAAQANVDFYAGLLGLRMVKKTVNFDDPGTYHLYYGDALGSPGSLLTFFPWANAAPGRRGPGETAATAYAVPAGSLDGWMERLADRAADFDAPAERFGQRVLTLRDPDGMVVELVEDDALSPQEEDWTSPAGDLAPVRFHSVTLCTHRPDATARVLTDLLGYEEDASDDGRSRFANPNGSGLVDLSCEGIGERGRSGKGTVHHVAFRVPTDEAQREVREALSAAGLQVTGVRDRQYFRSIYFREPGGVLFEVATDPPGFTTDEPLDSLGEALRLPPQYEELRPRLEQTLPTLTVPT